MKIKKALIVLFLSIFVISCDEDADDFIERNENLVGSWTATHTLAEKELFDVNNDSVNSTDVMLELDCQYYVLQLNDDFTFYRQQNTWYYDTLSSVYSCQEVPVISGFWTVNEELSVITFTINGDDTEIPITYVGGVLSFRSEISFLNKNAAGEIEEIFGEVFYRRF